MSALAPVASVDRLRAAILRKRQGRALTAEQIAALVASLVGEQMPVAEVSALVTALACRGMSEREVAALTRALIQSGVTLDLRSDLPDCIELHTTSAIGDTTELVVMPLLAALGIPTARMTAPGFGAVPGPADTIRGIPGIVIDGLSRSEIVDTVARAGAVLFNHGPELVPADASLYALRERIAADNSVPLIVASIMSKKLASGTAAIHINVKYGEAATVRTAADAFRIARGMAEIAARERRRVVVAVYNTRQPLGSAFGSVPSVRQALATLSGDGPDDYRDHALDLASQAAVLAGVVPSRAAGRAEAENLLRQGHARTRFLAWIAIQGGDAAGLEAGNGLPRAPRTAVVSAGRGGYARPVPAETIREVLPVVGAARSHLTEQIDPRAGVQLLARPGRRVRKGQALAEVHALDDETADRAASVLAEALQPSPVPVAVHPPRLQRVITGHGTNRQR